ncbi:MAG: hypothetical protein HUJ96_01115 [Marinilabiliaceae bacterium]|nr:hypothetical protein [Marinilabiliaceae bacterium]
MVKRIYVIILLLISVQTFDLSAQRPMDFKVSVKSSVQVGTNSLQPLWSYSNQWGTENMFDQANFRLYAKATGGWKTERMVTLKYSGLHTPHSTDSVVPLFSVNLGLAAQLSTADNHTFIHEGYVTGNLWIFDYTLGLHAFTPIVTNNELSSGSYLMSSNSRPLPRVGVGLFKYWSLPFTWNLIQLRGGLFFSYMDNEGNRSYTDDILFHEKYAYGRLGTPFVKPYVGIVHSVMMGGKLPTGVSTPIDFWNSFFGRSGSKSKFENPSMRGEITNAAGGHQGMWDIGLDVDVMNVSVTVYYQRPFSDSKAQPLFFHHEDGNSAKDKTVGVDVRLPFSWLKHINLEYVKTDWQGSIGTPDPVVIDKHGKIIYFFPGDYAANVRGNWEEWMNEHIPAEYIESFNTEVRPIINANDLYCLIVRCYNRDSFEYGGRTNYMSNSYFRQGWSREGLCMGSAFFHTNAISSHYAPTGTIESHTNMTNVRLLAVNFGISGSFNDRINYRFKYAYSHNYGSYIDRFKGAYSWEETENYFYGDDGLTEHYLLLEATYNLKENLSFSAQITSDFGDMYDSSALKISATYNF